jgi:hypothetical protein
VIFIVGKLTSWLWSAGSSAGGKGTVFEHTQWERMSLIEKVKGQDLKICLRLVG